MKIWWRFDEEFEVLWSFWQRNIANIANCGQASWKMVPPMLGFERLVGMVSCWEGFPLILLMVQKSCTSCLDLLKVSDFFLSTMVNYHETTIWENMFGFFPTNLCKEIPVEIVWTKTQDLHGLCIPGVARFLNHEQLDIVWVANINALPET